MIRHNASPRKNDISSFEHMQFEVRYNCTNENRIHKTNHKKCIKWYVRVTLESLDSNCYRLNYNILQ